MVARRQERIEQGLRHLRSADPVMARMIRQVGPFAMRLERNRFWMLVRAILSQQLSTKAARTICARVEMLLEGQRIPQAVGSLTVEQLRTAGVSLRKSEYILELAQEVASGNVVLANIGRRKDEEIVKLLTEARGIGRWTAEMFLIFSLGRLDVLPVSDLGIRTAIRDNYALTKLPSESECQRIGSNWRPFTSVASWYCWRSIDAVTPKKKTGYPV